MEKLVAKPNMASRFIKSGYTQDIMDALIAFIRRRKGADTKEYVRVLRKVGDELAIFKKVWHDHKNGIRYQKDPEGEQNLKSAARLWHDLIGDCKAFAIAIADICFNFGIAFSVRFTKYRKGEFSHVYIIVHGRDGDIIMDPVWDYFNSEKIFFKKVDYRIDMTEINELTGLEDSEIEDIIEGVAGDISGLDGVDHCTIHGINLSGVDISGAKDIWNKAKQKGKDAVNKLAKGALQPVLNWLLGTALKQVSPYFIFQWVQNTNNQEVLRRKTVQRNYLNWISQKCGIKMDVILQKIKEGVQSKLGKSPEELIKLATQAKVSGIGVLPALLLNPATMRLAVGGLKSIAGKLLPLLGKGLQALSERDASDMKLLAVGKSYNIGDDKNKKPIYSPEIMRLVDANKDGRVDQWFDKQGNEWIDAEFLSNGAPDMKKIKALIDKRNQAELDRRKKQSEKDKDKNKEKVDPKPKPDPNPKPDPKPDPQPHGGGNGNQGGGGNGNQGGGGNGGGDGKKDNTMLYVGVGVGAVLLVTGIYLANK
jgi:hypothetical protein